MHRQTSEWAAILLTLAGIAAVLFLPLAYQSFLISEARSDAPVITLTGVASLGVWTSEEVRGINYWTDRFPPARPVLQAGRKAILRLASADVTHTFYCPALEIGPVEVQPGHVVEVEVTPKTEGTFRYHCTMVCGMPHFGMQGEIVVSREKGSLPPPSRPEFDRYWLKPPPPVDASLPERGEWLFQQRGCFTCHGRKGEDGIANFNYVKETVPALNTLAERLMLFVPEDAQVIMEALEEGIPLQDLAESAPIPRFNVFLAQYRSIRDVIRHGNAPGKKNPEGPDPPLEMLAWGQHLTERDIDALIAYLLTLQPWEEPEPVN